MGLAHVLSVSDLITLCGKPLDHHICEGDVDVVHFLIEQDRFSSDL